MKPPTAPGAEPENLDLPFKTRTNLIAPIPKRSNRTFLSLPRYQPNVPRLRVLPFGRGGSQGRSTLIQESHTLVREPANGEHRSLSEGFGLDIHRIGLKMVYNRLRGRQL